MPMINKNIVSRRNRLSNFYSVMSNDIPFSYVEAFKTLRTNLEFLSSTDEIKSILITALSRKKIRAQRQLILHLLLRKVRNL